MPQLWHCWRNWACWTVNKSKHRQTSNSLWHILTPWNTMIFVKKNRIETISELHHKESLLWYITIITLLCYIFTMIITFFSELYKIYLHHNKRLWQNNLLRLMHWGARNDVLIVCIISSYSLGSWSRIAWLWDNKRVLVDGFHVTILRSSKDQGTTISNFSSRDFYSMMSHTIITIYSKFLEEHLVRGSLQNIYSQIDPSILVIYIFLGLDEIWRLLFVINYFW